MSLSSSCHHHHAERREVSLAEVRRREIADALSIVRAVVGNNQEALQRAVDRVAAARAWPAREVSEVLSQPREEAADCSRRDYRREAEALAVANLALRAMMSSDERWVVYLVERGRKAGLDEKTVRRAADYVTETRTPRAPLASPAFVPAQPTPPKRKSSRPPPEKLRLMREVSLFTAQQMRKRGPSKAITFATEFADLRGLSRATALWIIGDAVQGRVFEVF